MRTMESSMRLYGLFCAALLPVMMCLSCNKLISDLIPPDEQKLISLDLRNVERYVCSTNTAIRDHSVTVTVPKGTDVTRLLPEAVVSAQATLFPVTLRYLQEAFPATDVLKIGSAIGSFENIEAINKWFFEMYAENPNFTIPPLVFPINFLSPVPFAVIGGQGRIELYTVKVLYDDGTDPATGTLPEGVPAEKNILSFSVGEPQLGHSVIGAKTVDFEVKAGTEVRALTVQATVSPHAILIPLTEPYLVPLLRNLGMDPLSVLSGYITAPNKEGYLRALFAPVDISNLTVPLNKPIDFTNPVQFAVLGNDKDVKLYTARCKQTVTGAVLKNFGFSKVKNSALVKDGTVRIDHAAKTVTAELFYPVEYANTGSGAFSLYCDVAYAGDAAAIEYKGTRYNAADTIPFMPENPSGAQYHLGTAEAKIIITFGGEQTEYRLFILFKEDPDTVRSITDFRFTKDKNSELKTLSMAAIANDGHEGTITATVLYTGSAKPESLIPTFITPGTVTVNGAAQTSGSSAQDFRRTLAYICTSRDGQYTRKYTVKIRFVYAEPAQSLLKTFRFPAGVNPLTKDSEGRIDQTAHTVHISAHYAGERPKKLIPEFSATGEVTVDALTQSSGFSVQDFEYPVYYKVTDPSDPSTYTIYAVTVHFEYSADSGCELTEFKLLMQDNPSLTQDVTAFISAHSGVIYALLPRGADVTNLIPRFTAQGRVTADGVEQTSGETAADFSSQVEYKVTSENGLYTKIYRVTVQQSGGIIYVDPKATGRGNGSTWEDAFTNLEAALQKANEIPAEVSAEIWLSKDCKSPEGKRYKLKRALIFRGGFSGVETEADQRNKNNKSLFNHDIAFFSDTPIRGTLTFDGIEFAGNAYRKPIIEGIQWDSAADNNAFVIENCRLREDPIEYCSGADFRNSARLATVTVKDTLHDIAYNAGDIWLPNCDIAVIDNCRSEKNPIFINMGYDGEPAQKVVIKNSYCIPAISAKDITVSDTRFGAGRWHATFRSFDRILLSGITGPSPRLAAALSASISIKNCKISDELTISTYNRGDEIPKLKNVSIEKSAIDIVTAYAITEKLYLYDIPGWDNKSSFKGCWINIPACSVEIRHCDFGEGGVFTACRGKIFKDIMEAVPVHTDILGVKADYIYCGYVQYTGSGLGFDGFYATEDLRNTAAEYRLPPYSLKLGEDWAKIYRELYGEPVPFKSGGSHLLKDLDVKGLYVFSGDSITLEKGNEYRGRLNGILLGPLTFYYEYSSANNINYLKHEPECSSVVLNNETTPNSTINIDGIRIQGEWLRAITNNLSMRNIEKAYPTGCMELYGYDRVSVDSCDFSNLSPFYDDRKDSPNGRIRIRPSFIAAGRTVNVTNCTFDPLFFDVRSGTCFDGQRNGWFNCTAAVWKK